MEQAKRKIFTGCYFRKAVIPVSSVMIRRLAILCIINYILVILLVRKEIKFKLNNQIVGISTGYINLSKLLKENWH